MAGVFEEEDGMWRGGEGIGGEGGVIEFLHKNLPYNSHILSKLYDEPRT
jgi:hypothetical protein